MNAALRQLYFGDCQFYELSPDDDDFQFDFDDSLFDAAAREILDNGGYTPDYLTTPTGSALINETNRAFTDAISKGLGEQPDPAVAAALRENAFIFSGFKTHAELEQVAQLITDENGNIRPFNEFLNDVQKLNKDYNHTYLRTEYNQAVQAAQMASKWADFERDKDFINLQYRTANDERVRASHRILHGVTLPVDDKFWQQYTPPNGWGCRCTVVAVPKDDADYPVRDAQGSTINGKEVFPTPAYEIFKTNTAKDRKLFPDKHPYLPKGCGNCGKTLLAYNPKSIKCKACGFIKKLLKKKQCKDKIEQDNREAKNHLLHDTATLNKIKSIVAKATLDVAKNPLGNNGSTINIITDGLCLKHAIKSMFTDPDFILKNEDLKQFDKTLLKDAVCVDWNVCDTSHNGPTTGKLKNKIDYFFYFWATLSNGSTVYLHVAHFKPKYGGKYELYHISRTLSIKK